MSHQPTATLHHTPSATLPSTGPMFPTWESFVFSVSAAMMWDNVGGQWSRQGSIGISILLRSPCPPAGVFFFSSLCDKATGADGVWLHTLFLVPFVHVYVCVCV